MSSQANISNTPFDQRSQRPPEVGVSQRHRQTHKQTDKHGDSMTESAQWADSVKISLLKFSTLIKLTLLSNWVQRIPVYNCS